MVSNKSRWSEKSYDSIFRLTLALTNLRIRWHPLRDTERKTYERYVKRLRENAETGVRKRQKAQVSNPKRRRRAMERCVRVHEEEENASNMLENEYEEEGTLHEGFIMDSLLWSSIVSESWHTRLQEPVQSN